MIQLSVFCSLCLFIQVACIFNLLSVSEPPVLEAQVPEQISVTVEDGVGEEVYNPENEQVSVEEEEVPVAEVLDEIPDDSQMISGLASQIEEVPKKSYASIVCFQSKNTLFLSIPF